MNKLKDRLKERRLEMRFSQDELAKISGVSRTTISMLETGEQTVTKSSTILALAKALKIKPQKLLDPES